VEWYRIHIDIDKARDLDRVPFVAAARALQIAPQHVGGRVGPPPDHERRERQPAAVRAAVTDRPNPSAVGLSMKNTDRGGGRVWCAATAGHDETVTRGGAKRVAVVLR
jgi:hypothetical protein